MLAQRLKVGDKVKCCGIIGHPYLEDESFDGATGTITKQGDDWGMWILKFDEP